MSAVFDAIHIVERLERAAMRDGAKLPQARERVARGLGVSPGTLQSIRRGRVKRLAHDVFVRLCEALARQLESEIKAAAHDLEMVRARGAGVDSAALQEVDVALAHARSVLAEVRK
jgi:transcriptional regulator with XRE-family HTH domain